MCGIVGFTGTKQAAPVLLDGLSKLEYRGYDSAGIAVRDGESETEIIKEKGKLKNLQEMTDNGKAVKGCCGIGHTRWATHGEPSALNAHPHSSDDGNVIAVHNGIIENYQELREKLMKHGYVFHTQTDTEVAVKLIDYYYKKYAPLPIEAIARSMVRIRGSYALCVMFKDYPGEIYCARKDSPMIIGVSGEDTFVASDVPAILKYTRNVYYIGNMEIAKLEQGKATFFTIDSEEIQKPLTEIKWDAKSADKGNFEHFMLKEIYEQPNVIRETIDSVVKDGKISFDTINLTDEEMQQIEQVYIVACGSAYHVGVDLQYVMESLTSLQVRVELASEFRYRKMTLNKKSIVIVISQSGETADTLEALRSAKNQGIKTLGIVNVVGSSIAREADNVFYTQAGPEIAVATTKAYSTQLVAGYLLSLQFAKARNEIEECRYQALLEEIYTIPDKVERILEDKERLQWYSAKLINIGDAFFIGRGIDYAIGLEGSLKLKEISYIHSEAYAAGELKHGPISLIENGTLVISIATQDTLIEKTVSNMAEVKSRGAKLMAVTTAGNYFLEDTAEFTCYIPKIDPLFAGSLSVIPLQLLSYYVSIGKGFDADKPRNLAKSVTVE
ncbi:MAG: glutamine--fructose-6-phosphate transaminase (isomerizing) [Oscillospiraceae bacterium]|nr:glutamine--fructose-6-phosphate transaminase (isomerizing) [Oscillospiraceae bacterium]